MRPLSRALRGLAIFAVSVGVVWSQLARAFDPVGDEGAKLLAEERATLHDEARESEVRATLRETNPEWDLMRRTFLGLTLANAALREVDAHARAELVADLDRVAEGLLADEARGSTFVFLLPYAKAKPFFEVEADGPRSLFVDGEIALVLAARALVAPSDVPAAQASALAVRVTRIERAMRGSPSLSGESYPDEAWAFCNTTALAALALDDAAHGGDHRPLADAWLTWAKAHLVEKATGLLVSSYRRDGSWLDGPEGSSIFMSAHNLLLWDEDFARDQWTRAKSALLFDTAGFTLAREWPRQSEGPMDVDSGPVIPLLDASPGASGLAVLGAAAFEDDAVTRGLLRSLRFAAFPRSTAAGIEFAAAGPMGNAVVAYALSVGPLWDKARRARRVSARLDEGGER